MTGIDTASQLRLLLIDARSLSLRAGLAPGPDDARGAGTDLPGDTAHLARALRQELVRWSGHPDNRDACLLAAMAVVLLRSHGEHKWAVAFDALLHLLTGVTHAHSAPPSRPL